MNWAPYPRPAMSPASVPIPCHRKSRTKSAARDQGCWARLHLWYRHGDRRVVAHAARAASLAICRDGFLLLGGLRGCWLRGWGIRLGGPAALSSRTVQGYPDSNGSPGGAKLVLSASSAR